VAGVGLDKIRSCEANVTFPAPRHVERIEDCCFYHTMELPDFGVVKGHWDLRGRFDEYTGKVDVVGKSVLDVGTATGFLSFEAERHGATRVVSFDMSDVGQQHFVPFAASHRSSRRSLASYAREIEQWKNAYWLCHRLLRSRAEAFYGDVYHIPLELGQFDVTIVGSILEHLRDPVKPLESIVAVTRETLVIVTPVVESEERTARFEPRRDNPEQDFTWWTYSVGLYRELFGILGFEIQRITTAQYWHEYEQRFEPRTTIVAARVAGLTAKAGD
jgi:SAM-dependent methyltransferase